MPAEENKLDNPVYHSLSESHTAFAIDYEGMKFYHPDYGPFGGFTIAEGAKASIDAYAELIDSFFVLGEKPPYSDNVSLQKELVADQMILHQPVDITFIEQITPLQTAKQKQDLFNLVSLVQPGYFKEKTPELGEYFGIYKNDQLVSVTGERMNMNGYTEVSAVVTHPEHTGKGYAKQLTAHTANNIFSKNKIPFLHVTATNTGAFALYQKLGFVTRRKISFWHFVNNAT